MRKLGNLFTILVSLILLSFLGGLESSGQHLADNVIANSDSYQNLEKPVVDSLVGNRPGRKIENKAFGVGEKLEY